MKILIAWSSAEDSALKLEEILPVGKALGVSLPFVYLMSMSPPPFLTALSADPPVQTWVDSFVGMVGFFNHLKSQGFHLMERIKV